MEAEKGAKQPKKMNSSDRLRKIFDAHISKLWEDLLKEHQREVSFWKLEAPKTTPSAADRWGASVVTCDSPPKLFDSGTEDDDELEDIGEGDAEDDAEPSLQSGSQDLRSQKRHFSEPAITAPGHVAVDVHEKLCDSGPESHGVTIQLRHKSHLKEKMAASNSIDSMQTGIEISLGASVDDSPMKSKTEGDIGRKKRGSRRKSEDVHPDYHSESAVATMVQRNSEKKSSVASVVALASKVAGLAKVKAQQLDQKLATVSVEETYKVRRLFDFPEEELLRIKSRKIPKSTSGGSEEDNDRLLFTPREKQHVHRDPFQTDKVETHVCIIHPRSRRRLCWELLALLFLLFDLAVIPMHVFGLPPGGFLGAMEWLTTLYWTLDIGLTFATGVYVGTRLEVRTAMIAKRYLRGWLPFDLVIICPEWIYLLVESDQLAAFSLARALRASRFFRVVRILRLLRLVKVQKVLQAIRNRTNNTSVMLIISISKLVCFILCLSHVFACTWYAFGDNSKGWVYIEGINNKTLGDRYLYSFQWSLSRLHPTNMADNMKLQTLQERMLAIVTTVMATVIASVAISSITNTMAEIGRLRALHLRKKQVTRQYCSEHYISPELTVRVKKYIDTESEMRPTHCEGELMQMLPHALVMDLRHEAWAPVISRNEFFNGLHQRHSTTERDTCHKALLEVPMFAGDTIFTSGDACSRMLFIVRGRLCYVLGRIMGSGGRHVSERDGTSTLEQQVIPGHWLCEAVLWTIWENCGELTSVADGTALALMLDKFHLVLQDHESAMLDAAIYARAFVEVLNRTDLKGLSDLSTSKEYGRRDPPTEIEEQNDTKLADPVVPYMNKQASIVPILDDI